MEHTLNHGMCRCCASEGMFKNFTATYQWMGADEVYADMLKECFDVSLTTAEDYNNGGICEVCITQLRNASNFKKQVLQTEEQFKKALQDDIFKSSIVKEEVNKEDGDFDSDNNISEDFSGTEFEVPIKEENVEPKAKKRSAKASTSSAKRAKKEDGEPSNKRIQGDMDFDFMLEKKIKHLIKTEPKKSAGSNNWKVTINKTTSSNKKNRYVEEKSDGARFAFNNTGLISEMKKHLHNIRSILLHSNATPIRNHNGIGYVCGFCDSCYQVPGDLKTHTLGTHIDLEIREFMQGSPPCSHTVKLDITNLQCTICNENIDGLEQIMKHLQLEHDIKMYTDINNRIVPFQFKGEILCCCFCAITFESFKGLREHMNTHLRNFVCEECNAPFVTSKMLQSHMYRHKKGDFKCNYCSKMFETLTNKRNHEKFIHEAHNKRNKCPYCSEKFVSYRHKRQHMETEHGVERSVYKCMACEKTFNNQSRLTLHTKRVHLLQKDAQCPMCDSKFFGGKELKNHMLKHTGERQYKCDVCLKSYGRKSTLREHMRIHENDRRFKCEHCAMAFVQKCSWRSHMRTKHSDAV